MSDVLREALLRYAPQLERDYKDFVIRQFSAMQADLGSGLIGVYSSRRWSPTFRSISCDLHQDIVDAGRSSVWSIDSSKLGKSAKQYGERVALEWYGKLREKLGELDDVTASEPGQGVITVKGHHGADEVVVEQQPIINVSSRGLLFHQFPARMYVNGKYHSEADYKRLVQGWNVAVVQRERKPKREPIDPDTRPKKYYYTYKVDYPAVLDRPARLGIVHRESAKGMSPDEALSKIMKQEERFDRDYPPEQRRRLYGFELDAIYAWNDVLIWKRSSGLPAPAARVTYSVGTKQSRPSRRPGSPTLGTIR
jgi:hypothetical protein